MGVERKALVFESEGRELVGILELPETPGRRGIVIVTGGPQYRAGSHRQFTLLSRTFVASGYPVFRFDYHGMGDSAGPLSDFTDSLDDLNAAIRVFQQESGVVEIVLWGLCDAASASLMCVAQGAPIAGLVLMNPWVRSDQGLARTHLRYYYLQRLFSLAFLKRLFSGDLNIVKAVSGFFGTVKESFAPKSSPKHEPERSSATDEDFRETMLRGFAKFERPVLLMLSGDDLTANEFVDLTKRDGRWRKLLKRKTVTQKALADADHTFSRRTWRRTVGAWTIDWLDAW